MVSLGLLVFRAAIAAVAVFCLTVDLIWWGSRTRHLVRILDGHLIPVAFGHVVPALWLWFTGLLALLVIPPLIALWVAWRRASAPALLAAGLLPPLIAFAVSRWGAGLFPLFLGPGGYYIRILPFGQ